MVSIIEGFHCIVVIAFRLQSYVMQDFFFFIVDRVRPIVLQEKVAVMNLLQMGVFNTALYTAAIVNKEYF